MAQRIAIDDRLQTAMLTYPFTAGWVDAMDVTLRSGLTPTAALDVDVAMLDSVAALTMLSTHVILRDVAAVWRTASMLTLTTHTRPDAVENVAVSIPGISPAGRALATATLQPFYGIRVSEWLEADHPVDDLHATISEGAQALVAIEDESDDEDEGIYQEDLGRAWYLMTNHPFVSHLCVVRRNLLVNDPEAVVATVQRLNNARAVGAERGRELRRDLSKGLGIDRDTLIDVLASEAFTLDDDALDGLAELSRRCGLGVAPQMIQRAAVQLPGSQSA
jgi:predicted solute-binding protein